jgi:hypothetical protein
MFSFQTANNQTYTAEFNDVLSASGWTPVQNFTGDGTVRPSPTA